MAEIEALEWVRTGNDYVRDGLTGMLGSPKEFGDTLITGAINDTAVKRLGKSELAFYAGSVNGGLYSRVFQENTNSWGKRWVWETIPGSGYNGSQSIAKLAISADGRYLAVGQGNPSNYGSIASPSNGIQIARIKGNGSLTWLPVDATVQEQLKRLNIRSLEWEGESLVATTDAELLRAEVRDGNLQLASSLLDQSARLSSTRLPDNSIAIAGYRVQANDNGDIEALNSNVILIERAGEVKAPTGSLFEDYLKSLNENGYFVARASAHPSAISGKGILFIGSFSNSADGASHWVSRIDRLEINLESGEVESIITAPIEKGLIGSNQASNLSYYGNFSFSADPFDDAALAVYAGGNTFGSSPESQALTYSGGLTRIRLSPDEEGDPIENISYLYGPRVGENKRLILPPAPGQPHADSRSINFFAGADGPELIQTDDGGIWKIRLEKTKNGSEPKKGAWWMPLTPNHNGFQGLEVNMTDWGARANTIASSYQDNAASLGYFGDRFATNLWGGDGEVSIIDDAGSNTKNAIAYLTSQQYLYDGAFSKYQYDKDGFIKGIQHSQLILQTSPGSVTAWNQSPEVKYYGKQDNAPFLSPIEENSYRANKIAITGRVNAYEMTGAGHNSIWVRPLLKEDKPGIVFTAVDNTGQANVNEYSSLYLGGMHNRKNVLLGRQRSELESDTDQWVNGYVSEIEFANMAPIDFSSYGLIQDVSHRPSQSANDLLYILQGGGSLNWMAPASEGSEQYLHIGAQNQNISTFSLEQLGLNNIEGDNYGYQSVVYVPASESHGEKLVIGGLAGAWISELDGQGMPIKFEAMNWEGLESETAPGSYIKAMKYNPQDDLLILGTQGQGSWIYSFTGDIGERPRASELLHMSNVSLAQGDQPQLDKRGNQFNETIAIQLDSRLQDKNESTNIEIVLHNPDKWRKYMSMVSPYYVGEDGDAFTESVREQASNWYNILEPYGLKYRGGWETKQEIVMPFEFRPGISMFNLSINAKDFAHFSPAKLSYSVRTTDGKESITRRLKLISTLDAFKPLNTTDQLSSASDDNIIHYQSTKEALAKVSLAGNTLEMDLNHSYLDSGLRNNLASNIAPWSDLAIASGLTNESLLF